MTYRPEGCDSALTAHFERIGDVKAAIKSREIFEGRVLRCDSEHNLYVQLGGMTGVIPRVEGALGILEGTLRDVALVSRVGKSVCFRAVGFHENGEGAPMPVLSRRSAQLQCKKEYLDRLHTGDIVPARVTRTEGFGAFIDVGCGIISLIPIDMLSVSRIRHPADRVRTGQLLRAVLKSREEGKLTFSLKELLGTWEENAALFAAGDTVTGIVRSVESYGAFIELTPNLAGLTDTADGLREGQRVSVYIKSVQPQKRKIKLAVVEVLGTAGEPAPLRYFVRAEHLDAWQYSPVGTAQNFISLF